jgi:hypothetical protein
MSEKPLWNPVSKPNKSAWDLAAEDSVLGGHVRSRNRTCPGKVTRTRPRTWIRPVKPRIR